MKRFAILFSLALVLLVQNISYAQMRNWTGSNGKVIEAEFISFDSATEIVKIKLKSGKEQNVKLSLFSSADQDFVKSGGKTSDNPFGEAPAPQKPSKSIDMKIVLDEAKKAIDDFEKTHKKPLAIGNLPLIYADYAVIRFHAGEIEEAKKLIDKAIRQNESVTDENDNRYNKIRIAERAIVINCKDVAKNLIDDVENTDSSISLAVCQLELGNETDAMLTVAKQTNTNVRTYGLVGLGDVYLKRGNVEKAKELFNSAESIGTDYTRFNIVSRWIKMNRLEEAQAVISRIHMPNDKSMASRELAIYYFINGDSVQMKKHGADALLMAENEYQKRDNAFFFFLINDMATSRKLRSDALMGIEDKAKNVDNPVIEAQRSVAFYNQEMLLEGTSTPRQMIERIEKMPIHKSGTNPGWLSNLYFQIASTASLFGDSKCASDAIKKAEHYVREKSDSDNDKQDHVRRLERTKNNCWAGYEPQEVSRGFPILMKSGQSERIMPILDRIKLPQTKVYALRVIAEELSKQKD